MSDTRIASVHAWEVLDSRGTPTVACEVRLAGGARGEASVPSGASRGTYEAHELRDGGDRYGGKGVLTAVRNVSVELAPVVVGLDASDHEAVDAAMLEADGTPDLERIGANAVLAVSLATVIAHADAVGAPLYRTLGDGDPLVPMPMVNIVSGGAHAGGAVDIQDVLAVPVGARSFAEALEWTWRVREGTAEEVLSMGLPASLVADEGGLGPPLPSNGDAVALVVRGTERARLRPGEDVGIAVDVAATQFHRDGAYVLAAEGRTLTAGQMVDELEAWCDHFPIVSIEDALSDEDWDGWRVLSKRLRHRTQLLGDDLFVTHLGRLERGMESDIANSVLVKPNQNGTVSGAAAVARRALVGGYAPVVSARSGETEDAWLADMTVGWRAGQIKVGSTTRSERTAKWNRLLRISDELGEAAVFAGRDALAGGAG